jgi:hypothetical protein
MTDYELCIFACSVAPEDGTGVGPGDRTGAPLREVKNDRE